MLRVVVRVRRATHDDCASTALAGRCVARPTRVAADYVIRLIAMIRLSSVGAGGDVESDSSADKASPKADLIRHIWKTLLPMLLFGSKGSTMKRVRETPRRVKKQLDRDK